MYHFEYVPESQTKPVKKELLEIIYAVQDLLRDKFTFRFDFIGSSARNMITQDVRSNIGFDFGDIPVKEIQNVMLQSWKERAKVI